MNTDTMIFLIRNMIPFMIPLTIVALGGMFSERSGVVNIALEGIMVFGASFGIFFIYFLPDLMSPQLLILAAMGIAIISGVLFSWLHAYASINLKANQTISGTALNLFAFAFHDFLSRLITKTGTEGVSFKNVFRIEKIPFFGDIPVLGDLFFKNVYLSTFIGLGILAVSSFVLYKTRFGLRLRACGEHPHAADSVGINVNRMRYWGVLISGALAGLGGLVLIIPTTVEYTGTVSGYGFLALAVLIFGQWKPSKIFLAAAFFGLMQVISNSSGLAFFTSLGINKYFYQIVPYLTTLIVLTFTSSKSASPRAAGEPYDQGKR
jgi:general nucleoside transport system permease protein